jgi:hypothetical protein
VAEAEMVPKRTLIIGMRLFVFVAQSDGKPASLLGLLEVREVSSSQIPHMI